ncbi:MAG: ABC transporter ATP-binding protein [Gammaproteobacteria bacterium]|nr:ABC transporter ATP-binding protein [Gammaproteobacteria bacterium]
MDQPPRPTAGGMALSFTAVAKRLAGQVVLAGLDLAVREGECFALVGVNGAGKTTAIKTLLDFSRPDAGTVAICGEPSHQPRARRHLAYLPERFTPPHYLSGRDFLHTMCRLHGVAFDPARVSALFEALALDASALDKPVRSFSKGMAQKLGLAMCFLSERPLLVLDEPMSGLDPQARALVKRHLQALRQQGRTLFFSTHLLADVEALCDRLAILHHGRLQFLGTPAACRDRYHAPDLEAAFLSCIADG